MEKNHLHGNLNNKREKWRKKISISAQLKKQIKIRVLYFFSGNSED
jgi:hypothetical protein